MREYKYINIINVIMVTLFFIFLDSS